MIAIQNDLTQKRAELKQSITARIEQTFPAYFFHLIGGVIKQVFNLKQPPHWSVNATVLCILIYMPGLIVAVASGEIRSWDVRYWTLLGAYIYAYFAPIVSHVNVSYNLLPGVRDGLVDFIQTTEDLEKLHDWLDRFFSFRGWLVSMILGGVAFGLTMSIYISWITKGLIGPGMIVINFSIGFFFAIPFWVIFKVLTLPVQLSSYRLQLYELNPARSEVVQNLIDVLNEYFYFVAIYVAIATVIASIQPFMGIMVWVGLFFGWGPSMTQFLVNQHAIRKIIASEKWRSLNSLQEQIRQLQSNNLVNVSEGTILRIIQLMDLHDRVSTTPNTLLNLNTWTHLLQQLILPLLALLLGNIDTVIKMLFR